MPYVLPRPRWALTPPFHPYLIPPLLKRDHLPFREGDFAALRRQSQAIGGIFLLHCLSPWVLRLAPPDL